MTVGWYLNIKCHSRCTDVFDSQVAELCVQVPAGHNLLSSQPSQRRPERSQPCHTQHNSHPAPSHPRAPCGPLHPSAPRLALRPALRVPRHVVLQPGKPDVITFQRPCLSVRSLFLGASSPSASPVGSCVLFVWVLFFPFKLPWNGRGETYMRSSPGAALPSTEQLPGGTQCKPSPDGWPAGLRAPRALRQPYSSASHNCKGPLPVTSMENPRLTWDHNPGICYNYIPMHYSIQFKYNPVFLKNPLLANIQRRVELKLLYICLRSILRSNTALVCVWRAVHTLAQGFPGVPASLRPKVPEQNCREK